MTRRGLLLALVASRLRADDAQQVWDLFTQLASALSAGNPVEFMQPFDRAMRGYETLQAEIAGLLLQTEVHSSIELLSDEGDAVARSVELDWFLQIVEKNDTGGVTRRRERVRCRLTKPKKKWQIVSIEPLAFFAPPNPAQ